MNSSKREVTLLVVEDDDIDAMAIERSFAKIRLTNKLIRANDGIEALEYLRGETGKEKINKPFIILLDLNMPRMNGLELLCELRDDPQLSNSVVFVLTTSAADKDQAAAHDKNVAGYIVKSELQNSFLEVIETVGLLLESRHTTGINNYPKLV